MKKYLTIAFSVILSDAGEATRALEIADGIRKFCPENYEVDIVFLSTGSRFEEKVISNGFKIYKCNPKLPGIGFHQDFKPTSFNLIGDKKLAFELIKGEIDALNELKPDVVIHGFYPIAGIARRMLNKPVLGICYLPIPLHEDTLNKLMKDIPDMVRPLTYLPLKLRKKIIKSIPKSLMLKNPSFVQTNIREAFRKFNYKGQSINNLFDMLRADLTIVNDFEEFYKGITLPDTFKIVGPLYASSLNDRVVDENIFKIFNHNNKNLKIFCTLGSSGKKEYLFEAIKALTQGIGKKWSAVILAPKAVCPIDEAIACAKDSSNIYITDAFVPAPLVNSLADVVISHGGQGTIQTAIASGTPIVGFAIQPEQQINLDNVATRGGAIRIPIHKWNANNIQSAVKTVAGNPSYKESIKELKKVLDRVDGKKNSAVAIWKYILKNMSYSV
ncbi:MULTISPECIES: nucleotide disphospho-sugar-binding domain-containing protein [Clostridium]|uniref:PGL/p-HBAD biosynthesis glycosyltransferase n=2 Tax=Clostridium TaxID=1485 RepID=D8GPA1_CLOLD|nr:MULTISPECIES: nucleotide disphospho-sugar-binding domain-containing protein [Clostridium]ADK15979.1 putative glycosyltransferase [Clostridium ljungdahlii DSM 13528]AGY75149.1 glycosyl transferase [Clostridium autoethanogenum DSM 10061]ALU35321.1 UDP-glucuronosyl/UDP-glucosyltransferase [Clostridium autoethanogenum DSM 10061]OAA87147.1 PGL/p-HBAD biosynthesis glycosyltransferase [Clostridium ljungdahlii DSM 13528]OVY49600.1 PGL/p-HBAD biosynthesis glycosyltransferase [Clostridium autoethanog